jgi:hypothetical protein
MYQCLLLQKVLLVCCSLLPDNTQRFECRQRWGIAASGSSLLMFQVTWRVVECAVSGTAADCMNMPFFSLSLLSLRTCADACASQFDGSGALATARMCTATWLASRSWVSGGGAGTVVAYACR